MSERDEKRGRRIRRLRTAKGFTQREVAERLDTDTAVISGWETGRRTPYLDNAASLANLLGVTLDYLATGRQSRHAVADV